MAGAANSLSGYAATNGTSFFYEIAGSGDPLVLIHAQVADRRMWDGQMDAFARHFKTIRYDACGYGRTKMGAGRHSQSADLHGLLQALRLDRTILLGSSQGGTAALDFAEESLVERPAVDGLGEIRVPTLIITGDQDDPSILTAGEFLASKIPNSEKVVIPGGAHLVNVEKPEEFNGAVLAFLEAKDREAKGGPGSGNWGRISRQHPQTARWDQEEEAQ